MKHFVRSWAARIRHALRKDDGYEKWSRAYLNLSFADETANHKFAWEKHQLYRRGVFAGIELAKRIYREMENEEYEA